MKREEPAKVEIEYDDEADEHERDAVRLWHEQERRIQEQGGFNGLSEKLKGVVVNNGKGEVK